MFGIALILSSVTHCYCVRYRVDTEFGNTLLLCSVVLCLILKQLQNAEKNIEKILILYLKAVK